MQDYTISVEENEQTNTLMEILVGHIPKPNREQLWNWIRRFLDQLDLDDDVPIRAVFRDPQKSSSREEPVDYKVRIFRLMLWSLSIKKRSITLKNFSFYPIYH